MVVKVTLEFIGEPTESERQGMARACQLLSKHSTSVSVEKSTNFQKALTAVFRMKNEAEYKVVDSIARTFREYTPSYNDMTISFEQEKVYDQLMKNDPATARKAR